MKKISLFMCAIALVGMCFTSCKKDNKTNLDEVIEDGFYCVGPATTVESINASNLKNALMGAGSNEVTKQKRAGMYEKYVYLDANKEFSLVLHKAGQNDVTYGADLVDTLAITDNETEQVRQYKGLLKTDKTMQVPVKGLYHIILDLNEVGDLSSMGGAMIAVVPCNWGLRGWQNDWGFRAMTIVEESAEKVVYKYAPATPDTLMGAQPFKFAHSNCWKFNLDMAGQVKAENSIGTNASEDGGEYTELLAGGKNIPCGRGIYDYVTLTWTLTGGAMAKSFSFEAHKCGDVGASDPANFVVGVSGSGLKSQDGFPISDWQNPQAGSLAIFDKAASTVSDETSKAGTYVYNVSDLYIGGEFKFRIDDAWIGKADSKLTVTGVSASGSDNISVPAGSYNIKITVDWTGETYSAIKAEFSKGKDPVALTYVSGRVLVDDQSGQAAVALYGWAPDKGNNNEIFGAWPGLATTKTEKIGGVTYKVFEYTKALKDESYKFILNDGLSSDNKWQTADLATAVKMTGADVKLIVKSDKSISVVQ